MVKSKGVKTGIINLLKILLLRHVLATLRSDQAFSTQHFDGISIELCFNSEWIETAAFFNVRPSLIDAFTCHLLTDLSPPLFNLLTFTTCALLPKSVSHLLSASINQSLQPTAFTFTNTRNINNPTDASAHVVNECQLLDLLISCKHAIHDATHIISKTSINTIQHQLTNLFID